MKYKEFHRSLLVIGLTLWVWLAAHAAGCISHIEPGQPDRPTCHVVYLPEVRR